jgi:hypothetical protein|nr:MAG TPA_asm: tail protein [Caudoviricetes sp.]
MANQHVNKVAVNGQTVLDLSGDTVYPGMLAKGITAHDKSGAQITGTLEVPAAEERMVELSMLSGNQVILPTSGKVMSKVTVQKPATLLPENIKKDVVIGGVTGSLKAGDTSETWVIKSSATGAFATTQISFTSNGRKFTSIGANDSSGIAMVLYYDNYEAAGYDIAGGVYEFETEAYRKLTFDTPPTGALLTWLQSNATNQNIISFKKTVSDDFVSLTHDDLVSAGLDTVEKYYAVKMISMVNVRHAAGVVSSFLCMGRTNPQAFGSAFTITRCSIGGDEIDSGTQGLPYAGFSADGFPYQFQSRTRPVIQGTYVNETYIVTLYLE